MYEKFTQNPDARINTTVDGRLTFDDPSCHHVNADAAHVTVTAICDAVTQTRPSIHRALHCMTLTSGVETF